MCEEKTKNPKPNRVGNETESSTILNNHPLPRPGSIGITILQKMNRLAPLLNRSRRMIYIRAFLRRKEIITMRRAMCDNARKRARVTITRCRTRNKSLTNPSHRRTRKIYLNGDTWSRRSREGRERIFRMETNRSSSRVFFWVCA